MKSITVFVMLDACRHNYIKKEVTPFLYELHSKGFFSPVKPTFGFEPDAAYLAGLYPDQADGGAQFWYYPEESPFKMARFLPRFLNILPNLPQKVLRKMLVKAARLHSTSPNLSSARIPFHLLNRFALPMKVNLDQPEFCNENKTVFDLLRKSRLEYLFHAAPEYRVTMTAACKRAQKELYPPLAFAFFHIGDLDGVGHQFGPDSDEINTELVKVDKGLRKIYKMARERFKQVNFVIMGDHGMIRVTKTIDLITPFAGLPLIHGKDYLSMLDSTMARFWFFSDRAEPMINETLTQISGGHCLGQKDKDKYHLNYPHTRFGDLMFLADPGCLIFPNHYQGSSPVSGMHGYAPENFGQQAAFIIRSERVGHHCRKEPVDMRQVFSILCDLLNFEKPLDCTLKSLIRF
jgi:predicted AlkP superfamily pyrophosphatase or phosphodiesterase